MLFPILTGLGKPTTNTQELLTCHCPVAFWDQNIYSHQFPIKQTEFYHNYEISLQKGTVA